MKKFLSFVLTFCLVLTTVATGFVTVFAEGNLIEDTSITWSFNEETGVLSFEGEGAIPDYNDYVTDGELTLKNPWKDVAFTSIEFAEGITAIGNYAFCYSSALESVTIPETVTVLGEGVFYNCEKLTTAVLPASVTVLPKSVFSVCPSLENVTLGSATTEISAEAFYKCSALAGIEFPSTLEKIGESAFSQCTALASVTFPEGMKSIADRAFYTCEALEEVNFPSTLLTIGEGSFASCVELSEIVIPDNVTDIPANAFNGCSALESVKLPAELYSVGDGAFKVCPELKSVEIPASITIIGDSAFGYGRRNNLVKDFRISGYQNTVARVYAEELELDFESLGYRTKGSMGEKIEWEYNEETNTLYVTGEGNTFGYTATDFVPHNNIPYENIEISADITGFGDYVFFNAPAVKFTLLEKVETIGEKAIGYCADADSNAVLREGTIIEGYDGLVPMTYAADNDITFLSLGKFIETQGKLGDDITWTYDKETKVLTVSGTGATYDYTIDELPYFYDYDIESIKVSDGITVIGDYAFCTSIAYSRIELGKDIVKIGKNSVGFLKSFKPDEELNPTDEVICEPNTQVTVAGYIITPADEYATEYGYTFEAFDADTYPLFSFVIPYSIDHMNSLIFIYAKNADVAGVMSAFPKDSFEEVTEPESIATGQTLALKNANGTYEYKFVVKGDVSGDGNINSSDALAALQHAVGKNVIEDEPTASAGDLNNDGKINSNDALKMLQISVGSANPTDMFDAGVIG